MKFSGRLLGLDLGRKRVGVALSDETASIANPLATIAIRDRNDLAAQVGGLVREHRVVAVVTGYPIRLDGTATSFSLQARRQIDHLKATLTVPVYEYDERFTSAIAQRAVHDCGKKLKSNRTDLDKVAAAVMLNDFIARHADR
ncbi:MAG: Holliday junction resolvase RuvX [Candidatus Edwardsbacteria bacterium]|nr:Holliday junction resolvase RuvX [Candidatus Edwardsbacteria bacterium]